MAASTPLSRVSHLVNPAPALLGLLHYSRASSYRSYSLIKLQIRNSLKAFQGHQCDVIRLFCICDELVDTVGDVLIELPGAVCMLASQRI